MVHLDLQISSLEKIWNGPNGILWGWGETESCQKSQKQKSCDTVPLKGPLGENTILSITSKIVGGWQLFGAENEWHTLKSSPFELRGSDSYFENRYGLVREFSSNWHGNHYNPIIIVRTGANFWLRTCNTCFWNKNPTSVARTTTIFVCHWSENSCHWGEVEASESLFKPIVTSVLCEFWRFIQKGYYLNCRNYVPYFLKKILKLFFGSYYHFLQTFQPNRQKTA
jgi:hypothetical protein